MSKYFNLDEKTKKVTFTGDKLECYIPKRYIDKGYLVLSDKVSALAIFSMKINDSIDMGILLPSMITMIPVETRDETINNESMYVCVLTKGSVFMNTTILLQDNSVGYFMYNEYLALGHLPSFITYDKILTLFDNLTKFSGAGIGADHAILEIIYAHMFRNPDKMTEFYRLTDMKKKPAIINLHDVNYGASTTHSRLFGAYANTGLNSALLNPESEHHELEDLFRS